MNANQIQYVERTTRRIEQEHLYAERALRYLYGKKGCAACVRMLFGRFPLISKLVGFWQKGGWTRGKIAPFIATHKIDSSEFVKPVEAFSSFNDFFVRKLKAEARPLAQGEKVAIMPADGRYRFVSDVTAQSSFLVKGQSFSLEHFVQDKKLAKRYQGGSLALCRLAPCDYHRFHFAFDCTPTQARLIQGPLFSVNPIAVCQNIAYLFENRRMVSELDTLHFGKVLAVEIGATSVGTIHQTFVAGRPYKKGDEKGFFSFGGSAIALLFEKGKIEFDRDLLEATSCGLEVRALFGQSLGLSFQQ